MHGLSTIKKQNESTNNPYDLRGDKVTGECLNTFQASMIADGCWELAGYTVSEIGIEKAEELYFKAYQHLIDTKLCWNLQGRIGREAIRLIQSGVCQA